MPDNFCHFLSLTIDFITDNFWQVVQRSCYLGKPNREFLSMNNIDDGIMRKNTTTAKLTSYEKERNKKILKVRYIVEQYFGLSSSA